MTWRAVVAALDDHESFRSRVSVYLHPLAGRPIIWHALRSLLAAPVPPLEIRVLHRSDAPLAVAGLADTVRFQGVTAGEEARSLRAAVTAPGMTLLVDGAAPLLSPGTIARLLRAGESGVTALASGPDHLTPLAVAGEGPALASAEDPRRPVGVARVTADSPDELLRVTDRHSLSEAAVAVRDRLVARHESAGVSFLLPATTWVDVDVRIGADTLIYPSVVLEGVTEIGSECVIGPCVRIVESTIGRGAELRGWNYVTRTTVRNQAVLEPYTRRGID